jgi:hypothetical protein
MVVLGDARRRNRLFFRHFRHSTRDKLDWHARCYFPLHTTTESNEPHPIRTNVAEEERP